MFKYKSSLYKDVKREVRSFENVIDKDNPLGQFSIEKIFLKNMKKIKLAYFNFPHKGDLNSICVRSGEELDDSKTLIRLIIPNGISIMKMKFKDSGRVKVKLVDIFDLIKLHLIEVLLYQYIKMFKYSDYIEIYIRSVNFVILHRIMLFYIYLLKNNVLYVNGFCDINRAVQNFIKNVKKVNNIVLINKNYERIYKYIIDILDKANYLDIISSDYRYKLGKKGKYVVKNIFNNIIGFSRGFSKEYILLDKIYKKAIMLENKVKARKNKKTKKYIKAKTSFYFNKTRELENFISFSEKLERYRLFIEKENKKKQDYLKLDFEERALYNEKNHLRKLKVESERLDQNQLNTQDIKFFGTINNINSDYFLKKIDSEFKDELNALEKKKNKLKEEKEKMEETLRYLDLYLIPKPVYSYQDELNYEKYILDQKAKNKVKREMEKNKRYRSKAI